MTVLRNVDVTATPDDTAGTANPGVETIKTLAGTSSVSVVAGVGLRVAVGAGSGDAALLQTPEKQEGGEYVESTVTGFFNDTQTGRDVEIGFIDGANLEGAFWRIDDGVVKVIRRFGAGPTETEETVGGVSLGLVHRWTVRMIGRHSAEFYLDGVLKKTLNSAAEAFTTLPTLRAGVRVVNPSAASGTSSFDIHRWTVEVDELPAERQLKPNAAAAKSAAAKSAAGGRLFGARVTVNVGAARYLMVIDKATAPANADEPLATIALVAAGFSEGGVEARWPSGLRCSYGVRLALSTTQGTLTLSGSSEGFFEAQYT